MNNSAFKSKNMGILTLSFDDVYNDTMFYALPMLKKYRCKATFNVISGLIGKQFEGRKLASLTQIQKARRMGMEIASHSLNHKILCPVNVIQKYLKPLPQKINKSKYFIRAIMNTKKIFSRKSVDKGYEINQKSEIFVSKSILEEKGFSINSFVYPGGVYNNDVIAIVKSYYQSARTCDEGLNNLKDINPYKLQIYMWDKYTTINEANNWLDRAIKEKAWIIEVFHLISEKNPTDYEYFTHKLLFDKHLQYALGSNIQISTQNETINKYLKHDE